MTSTAIVIRNEQHEILRAQVRERSIAPFEGEKRLMLAVLERAVDDLRTYANVPTGRGRWLLMEVAAWFDSSETGPFDFEGICQATGLDPDFIRKGLRGGHGHGRPARDRNYPLEPREHRRTIDARSCHYTTGDHSAGAREIWREATSDRAGRATIRPARIRARGDADPDTTIPRSEGLLGDLARAADRALKGSRKIADSIIERCRRILSERNTTTMRYVTAAVRPIGDG